MFNLDLEKSVIFQALKWSECPLFKFAGILKKLFLILFIFVFLFFLLGFLFQIFSLEISRKLFGFSIFFSAFFLFFWYFETFFNSKIKKPKIRKITKEIILEPESKLADFLSFESAQVFWETLKFAKRKNIKEINSSILFYFLLSDNLILNFIFSRLLLNLKTIKKILKDFLKKIQLTENNESPLPACGACGAAGGQGSRENEKTEIVFSKDFQDVFYGALEMAQKKEHCRIEITDLLSSLAKYNPVFERILIEKEYTKEDVENLSFWAESLQKKIKQSKEFWEYENLAKRGTLAKEWAAGFTLTLDRFSKDWTEILKKQKFAEIIGHQEAIKIVERVLSREQINNVLLVGEPGSGRGSVIQAIAQKCLFGKTLASLNYKRVVELDLAGLIAESQNLEQTENILNKIFQEVILAGNVILVIDEIHNYIGGKTKAGVIDISAILAPFLESPLFQFIGVASYVGLHQNIENNPGFLAIFEKVEISEVSVRETIQLLENFALFLEQKYKLFVSYPAIRDIVKYSKKYLPAIPFPKKAMDILDELMIYVKSSTKDKIVLPSHVAEVIFQKTQIPVGELESKEKEILLNLENLIHQRIINQEEGVREISAAMRRARSEVTIRKGPMGVFLFLGPTGVGKTETSKAMAEVYFGSEERMIRLDMSEFQSTEDISKLIGSTEQEGLLTTPLRENPFSLLLLDEIEKAHLNILNLFLQVFDEGFLTDGLGRKVDFKNTIIIATSNAGAEIIWEDIRLNKKLDIVKEDLLSFLFKKGIFRPEFINRFDAAIIFRSLTKENLLAIAELLFKKLQANLKEKGIEFVITESLKEKIAELGYSPVFGARAMKRVIQDKVENVLAVSLLSGKIKKGDKVEIDSESFEIKFSA